MKIIALIIFVSLLAEAQSLKGKVFIVTKDKSAIRLPLVEINIYELAPLQKNINKKIDKANELKDESPTDGILIDSLTNIKNDLESKIRSVGEQYSSENLAYEIYTVKIDSLIKLVKPVVSRLDKIKESYKVYENMIEFVKQPAYFFSDLDKPIFKVKSDDEGLFSIKLNKNVNYALIAHTDRYIVGTTEEYYWMIKIDKKSKTIFLSNDNLFETYCDECLVKISNRN